MAHLYQIIDAALVAAFQHIGLPTEHAYSKISTRPGIDRQCSGVIPAAKAVGADSRGMAEQVAILLLQLSIFQKIEVAGNGFLNLTIDDAIIIASASQSHINSNLVGFKDFLIDFGGPNIAKALHVGHLRSLVIGESLRRILIARGHNVITDIHLGDWGLPMGMLIDELIRCYPNFEVNGLPSNFGLLLETMYPKVVAACKTDPKQMAIARQVASDLQNNINPKYYAAWEAIRQASLDRIIPQIKRLGAHFDLWFGESDAQRFIPETLKLLEEHTRIDDGAIIIDVAQENDKKPLPPIIFSKSDDGYTYAATDLATIRNRTHVGSRDRTILYVVDNRQALHFQQVFRAAKWLPDTNLELVHVGFGTVNGSDGKPFKTRDGGVPTLELLLDAAVAKAAERTTDPENAEKIGVGAVKFADLITHRESGYVFDLDRIMSMEGKTGPYIQYACVRINAIFANASSTNKTSEINITHPTERDLLLTCANFHEALAAAESHLSPTFIAEYAFILAQKFSQFYAACPVLNVEEEPSRRNICAIVGVILSKALYLLGIEIPDRM